VKQQITGVYWDEFWTLDGNGKGPGPTITEGGPFDGAGVGIDTFSTPANAPTSTTNPKGDIVYGPLTHKYSITDEGGGYSGGSVGCPVKTYTGVNYYTYGVKGNSF